MNDLPGLNVGTVIGALLLGIFIGWFWCLAKITNKYPNVK